MANDWSLHLSWGGVQGFENAAAPGLYDFRTPAPLAFSTAADEWFATFWGPATLATDNAEEGGQLDSGTSARAMLIGVG